MRITAQFASSAQEMIQHVNWLWRPLPRMSSVLCSCSVCRDGIGQSDSITNNKLDSHPEIVPSNVHWCIPRSVNSLFTGRAEILRRIKSAITITGDVNMQRRFVITGIGGQGKSEICLKIADQVREACVNVHLLLQVCF
jgi:hypothetical protein